MILNILYIFEKFYNVLSNSSSFLVLSSQSPGGGAFEFNARHEMVLSAMTTQVKEGILPQSSETGASTQPVNIDYYRRVIKTLT